jgi:hypothetical protein
MAISGESNKKDSTVHSGILSITDCFGNWKSVAVAAGIISCSLWLASVTIPRFSRSYPKPAPVSLNVAATPMDATTFVEKRRTKETPEVPSKETIAAPDTSTTVRTAGRVVVYKDSNIAKANRKAEAINEIWPDLNAAVFSLAEEPSFAVATGGPVSRAASRKAVKRLKARGFSQATWARTVAPEK